MIIRKYRSVSNTEYYDILEVGQEGCLEGLSKDDLFTIIQVICETLKDEELLKALTIVEGSLFYRSQREVECLPN